MKPTTKRGLYVFNKKIIMLIAVAVLGQRLDAVKYILGIRTAGERLYYTQDICPSHVPYVCGGEKALVVLGRVLDSGVKEAFVGRHAGDYENIFLTDDGNWYVCIPRSSEIIQAKEYARKVCTRSEWVGLKPHKLFANLRILLGGFASSHVEFEFEPGFCEKFQKYTPHRDLACCGEVEAQEEATATGHLFACSSCHGVLPLGLFTAPGRRPSVVSALSVLSAVQRRRDGSLAGSSVFGGASKKTGDGLDKKEDE